LLSALSDGSITATSNFGEESLFSSPPIAHLFLTKTVNRFMPTQKYLYRNALSKQKA
jgi:hypothetical protein